MTKAAKKTNKTATAPPAGSSGEALRPPRRRPPSCGGRPAKTPIESPQHTRRTSKRNQLAALLVRDEGATIAQMQQATGWLPHTVRAALTGLKKLGYAIDSDKVNGLRTYRAVAPE